MVGACLVLTARTTGTGNTDTWCGQVVLRTSDGNTEFNLNSQSCAEVRHYSILKDKWHINHTAFHAIMRNCKVSAHNDTFAVVILDVC